MNYLTSCFMLQRLGYVLRMTSLVLSCCTALHTLHVSYRTVPTQMEAKMSTHLDRVGSVN